MNMAWSSDLYKMYNNALLKIVQQSGQGVDLGNGIVISGVGQADDVGLLSNDIHCLLNIGSSGVRALPLGAGRNEGGHYCHLQDGATVWHYYLP